MIDPSLWSPLAGPLHAEIRAPRPDASTIEPLILVHGFTQTRRSWDPFLEQLEFDGPIIRVDLPGHGHSRDIVGDLISTSDLLVETCGKGTYCGYSLGGRVTLHAALRHPDQVHRLIMIGATPGIEDDEERAARRRADDRLASRIEDIGVRLFVQEWLSQAMFAGLPRNEKDLAERRSNSPTGLANSLRRAGTGTQTPLWRDLHTLAIPVLAIAGSQDEKFTDIARRMVDLIGPHSQLVIVPEAGHSAHLENVRGTARAIATFLGYRIESIDAK